MKKGLPLIEVLVFFGLAELIIWGSGRFRPPVLLIAFIMLGICIGSNIFHRDTLEKIGLAQKNFWPTARIIFPIAIVLLIPLIFMAWGKETRGGWNLWFGLLGYPIWGFAQQYALLSFSANRFMDIFDNKPLMVSFLNGFLFSLAHLPNPLLTGVTFLAGVLFTYVFLIRRHLIPLALTHAAFGVGLSLAFGNVHGIMSVGPAYLSRIGQPF